ncbi:hypothetical protein V1387_06985, partial [Allomuricauda taeanensis]|uniref:hypothetical protein n=1 Tax=Flagellimonas taeanensis TaxID=1005926 RepID=UPI002E7BABAB
AIQVTSAFDGNGLAATPLDLADDAVTSAKILDGEIVDADVSATAAIQGTKIDPDFGTLDISTTGTISTTSNLTVGANTLTNVDGTNGQVLTTDGAGNASWQDTSPLAIQVTSAFDGNGLAATPLDLADDAVTSAKILDGEIVDADVSATAAIQGTKIDPDFGGLDVSTTGTLAAGNTTIVGTISTTSTATVGGSFTVPIRSETTGTVVLDDNDHTLILSGTVNDVVLPDPLVYEGRIYIIKNLTGAIITMTSGTYIPSDLVGATNDFETGVTQLQSDGTNWQQIN